MDIINGQLVRRVYMDWSKRQAVALFKREMRLANGKQEKK